MLFISNKVLLTVICCQIIFLLAVKPAQAVESNNLSAINGYSDIVLFKSSFFAVGTDGRIDCISRSGEKTPVVNSNNKKLNCAFSNDEILIAAGDHGTIMYSSDGKDFTSAETGTDKNIYAVTSKSGLIIAGSDGGTLLTSKNGKSWNILQTEAKGNIISISANNSLFIGVTDAGEILKSFDGIKWEIKDYNKEYAGYNKYSKFTKIFAAKNSIVIIGTHDDGTPSILFSSLGNVWAERIPVYQDDQGTDCYLANKPNGITYDSRRDQFILACDDGVLFILPACEKCNEYMKVSDKDFYALLHVDKLLLIVGQGFSVFVQNGI